MVDNIIVIKYIDNTENKDFEVEVVLEMEYYNNY